MSTICKVFICLIRTIINCSATKNKRVFPICFKSNFALAFVLISIVRPQIALQADGVAIFLININSPACSNRQLACQIIFLFLKGVKHCTTGNKLTIFIFNLAGTDSRAPGILVSLYIR